MKEQTNILIEVAHLERRSQTFALATVVKINGSTYRRPGARMLITPDGDTYGTISGGCLEQEVAQHALNMMEEDAPPQVLPFDLSDDDLILGFGIGCNGVVHVLVEVVSSSDSTHPLALIRRCIEDRQVGLLATVIGTDDELAPEMGHRLLLREAQAPQGTLRHAELRTAIQGDAAQVLENERPQIRQYTLDDGEAEVLFEVVRPPIHLLVFGTGHDVPPVIRIANELGWTVTVVGRKSQDELARRFPQADEHVFLMHPEQVLDHTTPDAWSAAVVMNHNFARDKALVHALLRSPTRYVGALGPRERTERIMRELRAENADLTEEHFDRLHGPVGLDIGTERPEEIALSIIAEVQAVFHDRDGRMLRNRSGKIHEPVVVT